MAGAVVSVSTGAMNTLLPKLSMLIDGEYKLQKGVKSGISFLRDELSSMHTLLEKLADNEERLDKQKKEWRNKVRELSYDIEDCIDLFMHKMSRGRAKDNLARKTSSKIKKLWSRHKIAGLIEELKARVEEESARRSRYNCDEFVADLGQVQIDPRLPALFVEAKRLVGIDGPREKIVELLKKDKSEQLKVVSIVGFGGLGKTTLANQVYHQIKGQFDCSSFIPVSRSPNIAKILTDMLKELGSSVDTSDNERQLIGKLRTFLKDKRYFIIVDDIWSAPAWELISSALPENNLCSRIITTTRDSNVAKLCCSSIEGYVHDIEPLSDMDSQNLFYKRVFHNKSSCPSHLEEVSRGIIKKCQGLPLAIISIASLLARKANTKDQWEQVYSSITSAFSQQGMRDILLLSYYDLPHHLKTCLLYLSMFPEDYEINRENLIWRWIAEGFITEVRGQTLHQVAENYFNELVNRSLIQPIAIDYDGRVEACRVHDVVLDLIVSQSKEENFASIVEGQQDNASVNMIRRLSVQSECVKGEVMQEIMDKCKQVRSIRFHGWQDRGSSHLPKLQCLRVLVFENCRGLCNQHIKWLGSFCQLTYLGINSDGITELPNQIGDLWYLQTLDIRGSAIGKLPPAIGRLKNLVRLLVSYGVELPNEIGHLQALQELSYARNYDTINFLEELTRLTKLRALNIWLYDSNELGDHDLERYEEALKSSLSVMGKHRLQSLEICCYGLLDGKLLDMVCYCVPCLRMLVVDGVCNGRPPKQISSLVNVTHLDIGVISIKQEDLVVLGCIPALLFFRLYVQHTPDERLTINSQQFRCLKRFIFENSIKGGGLEMVCLLGAMPELRRFFLGFRAKETESKMGFEFSFEHLATLEHLRVVIFCDGATRSRVEAAEAAVRNAASLHPGCPTLEINRMWEHVMVNDKDKRDERLECGMEEEEIQQEHS